MKNYKSVIEVREELDKECKRTGIEVGPRYGVLTRLYKELRLAQDYRLGKNVDRPIAEEAVNGSPFIAALRLQAK